MRFVDSNGIVTKIRSDQFRRIFGISWADFKKKDVNLRNLRFDDAWCAIDPYDSEISWETNPIVASSESILKEWVIAAGDEI